MINTKQTKKSGYILLLSVLFLGVIGMVVGIFTITTGIVNSQNIFTLEQSHGALSYAKACVESALQEIHDSTPFTGTATLTFDQGECSYEVTSQGGQNRTIEASGMVGTVSKKIQVTIDGVNPEITIATWQEVSDF